MKLTTANILYALAMLVILAVAVLGLNSQKAYKTGYLDGYNKHIQTYLPAPGLSKGPMAGLIEKENG